MSEKINDGIVFVRLGWLVSSAKMKDFTRTLAYAKVTYNPPRLLLECKTSLMPPT